MENTSEVGTLSNINSDICVDSGCTDQKLKMEIDQMISKRKKKNKSEFMSDKSASIKHSSMKNTPKSAQMSESENSDDSSHSDSDSHSVEVLDRMRGRNVSSSVSKHLSTSSIANNWKNDKKISKSSISDMTSINPKHVKPSHKILESIESKDESEKKYNKISQVTRDTKGDVLKILLILQKVIDESHVQRQKVTKLEIKIKEMDEKINNQTMSINNFRKSTSGTSHTFASSNDSRSDHTDFNVHSSTDRDCHPGNFREYELKFDRFKQEVNTEIIKINQALVKSNSNFSDQISGVREQLAMLFGKKVHNVKCC